MGFPFHFGVAAAVQIELIRLIDQLEGPSIIPIDEKIQREDRFHLLQQNLRKSLAVLGRRLAQSGALADALQPEAVLLRDGPFAKTIPQALEQVVNGLRIVGGIENT